MINSCLQLNDTMREVYRVLFIFLQKQTVCVCVCVLYEFNMKDKMELQRVALKFSMCRFGY